MTFGSRLHDAIDGRGRFCVGIDPHPRLLDAWGLTDSVNGLEKFALTAVEAMAGTVAVVKPQSAFFERHGSRGIAVLEQVVRAAHDLGALVLLDVKRGDIGSTSQAYADAYLDKNSPLHVDAITVSPYLGTGSLDPVLDTALAHDAGVFVLALTSNPEGPQVQHATTRDGRTVAAVVLDAIATRNTGAEPLGSIGAVVGATVDLPADVTAENLDVHGPLLVPGIGAQGGTVDDVRRVFGSAAAHVLPSSSREVLAEGPDRAALHTAALRAIDTFSALA
ncbi:MAG: orotidine-5'-phosphate decarboxylase [Nocardioidaceae bacterium]|nr:orotidine-5'-phosphate decarboxylase [Nocardioidaceae bacterium]NUS51116.1 orotidine-5'-phosphate decarboxylase [Nocardioidaceae bacterium]